MQALKCLPLLAILILTGCQPQQSGNIGAAAEPIEFGRIDRLQSSILDEEREVWVYLPRAAMNNEDRRVFPVVYLLDGNGHYYSVAGMLRQLSTTNGNKVVPEMIVVALPNTNRYRDLTPTHDEDESGGGTAFLDFIEHEVIPHVEANYPASQYRTFIGHSLGGLMAIEALVERTGLFDNFVAIDPSLWWDDQAILRKAEQALEEQDYRGKSLYLSVANTMRGGMTVDRVVHESGEDTRHIRSILQYARSAEAAAPGNGLRFAWNYYDDDTHGSVPLISEYDAMRFMFDWYDPKAVTEFFSEDSPDSPHTIVDFVSDHFENVSRQFGYRELPPRPWIDQLANIMGDNDKPQARRSLLQLNMTNYPDSPAVHEEMGDFLLEQEQQVAAAGHFRRALELGGSAALEEKLQQLASD